MVKSYICEKVEILNSNIHGYGMFAKEDIEKGEIVFIKGGHILSKSDLFSSDKINSYLPIDDNFYLAAKDQEEEDEIKLFVNHSCEPNCGLRGEITFISIRKIIQGEELTCDYAFIDNEDYEFKCNCGSSGCRKLITGRDWLLKSIQMKYGKYFAEYLKDKFIDP
jgi:uncharacterized protein